MLKKILIFLFIVKVFLLGYSYNNLLLISQAKIYPKLILFDKDIDKKTYENSIVLTIIYHSSDQEKAKELQKLIQDQYKAKLENYTFKVILKEFDETDDYMIASSIYMLNGTEKEIQKIISIAQKRHIILFSYELNYLKKGALISLHIEDEPNIYFNNKINKLYQIKFSDIFYQIVRFRSD